MLIMNPVAQRIIMVGKKERLGIMHRKSLTSAYFSRHSIERERMQEPGRIFQKLCCGRNFGGRE